MPASCQSLSRRQQVMPEPQPISCGSISQGMPLFSTNRMPVRAARSSTGGRPPFGRGGRDGRRGANRDQKASETRGAAVLPQVVNRCSSFYLERVLLGALTSTLAIFRIPEQIQWLSGSRLEAL